MKLYEFLSTGIKFGDRVIVKTKEGKEVVTTYAGLRCYGLDVIKFPDELKPMFRTPTIDLGGDMGVSLERIISVQILKQKNTLNEQKNTYEVDIFILGTPPRITKETVLSEGYTAEEAETKAVAGSSRKGWGVIGSRLVPESE